MAVGFSDNAYSAGDFTAEWTSSRFTITPLEGPGKNKPITLSGVWELSGMGFAREGVNLIFNADGSGRAVKITKGREAPNEISMKLDPLTNQNVVAPNVCPVGRSYRFNFVFQQVDPAGVATFERKWTGCVTTGNDSDTPSDNAMGDTFKFKPTRRG
jgi:hypothetical protein